MLSWCNRAAAAAARLQFYGRPMTSQSMLACSGHQSRGFSFTAKCRHRYGFIGLGAMGYPMAQNLKRKLAQDDNLLVFDVNSDASRRFVEEEDSILSTVNRHPRQAPVERAESAHQVASHSDTVITVLPEPQHVEAVFKSILAGSLPEKSTGGPLRLFIDCSTIDPATSRQTAFAVAEAGAGAFVDAPMSGGVVGARAGSLTFLLGAPAALVDRTHSVLALMGKRIFHLGDQGAGLAGKLANNYLLAISNIATCEAMNLGVRLGLDATALAELINASSGHCWSSEINNPVPDVCPQAPASRDYEGGFGVALMQKDLRLALAAADEAATPLPLGPKAAAIYAQVREAEPRKDFSVVYRWLLQQARQQASSAPKEPTTDSRT